MFKGKIYKYVFGENININEYELGNVFFNKLMGAK